MRPIHARNFLEQRGQDNVAGRAGPVETLKPGSCALSAWFWLSLCCALRMQSANLVHPEQYPIICENLQVILRAFLLSTVGVYTSLQFTMTDALFELLI